MPKKPARPCRYPRCPHLTDDRSGYCEEHRKQEVRQYDESRGTAAQRGYGARWQRYTRAYLNEHPLCVYCQKETPPRVTAATVVDHIKPHRGDPVLFWDPDNHQGLCRHHHSVKTATEDGAFGNPTR